MKQKVSVVHRIGGEAQFVDERVYYVPVDTGVDSQHVRYLYRINRMLTPGRRVRGDVAV